MGNPIRLDEAYFRSCFWGFLLIVICVGIVAAIVSVVVSYL